MEVNKQITLGRLPKGYLFVYRNVPYVISLVGDFCRSLK